MKTSDVLIQQYENWKKNAFTLLAELMKSKDEAVVINFTRSLKLDNTGDDEILIVGLAMHPDNAIDSVAMLDNCELLKVWELSPEAIIWLFQEIEADRFSIDE